jgi:histidine ammonia-lyase
MTVTLNSRKDLTLDNLERVAIGGESIRLGKDALKAMSHGRRSFMALLDSDRTQVIYGTTTGAGQQAKVTIPPDEQRRRARRGWGRPSGGGFGGGTLPERVVRMIIFARLANYIEGNAKTRPAIAERLAAMLDAPLPKVPLGGQVGAGEILPLFHIMSAMPEGDMEEAEPMSRVNGSPASAGLIADVALTARRRLGLAEKVFALSIEAIAAPLEAYDPEIARLTGDAHQAAALKNLRRHLAGVSKRGRRPYQAPVSWRILPQVLGAAHAALATAEEVAKNSLASITDNPVYVLPDRAHKLGRAFSTGGYHNGQAYPAIDGLNARWADFCTLADRHTTRLHEGEVSGLPESLAVPGGVPWTTGLLGFIQIGFGEEARHAAARTFLPPSEGGGYAGQNDIASPTFFTYRKHLAACEALDSSLAILARAGPPKLAGFLAAVRDIVPPVESRRRRNLGRELEKLRDAFADNALTGRFGNL